MPTRQEKAAATKRAALEAEFGLPYDQAERLRKKYHAQGYGAHKTKLQTAHRRETRLLKATIVKLRAELREARLK